ncbi:unnamed protein product [Cyberlindnera jadinii]|uniref:Uncharacterized protein n=1 Tax=Cyberlindnera jadinii (strain ATCC 18201 / CBS 1600 / BCRC 20928 / JCM 3617 / NBRC 0987 / NRRL Y-1542) TaxID=983966 RepID=A0A0H5C319_CYBJN|nr:unnamed protein product [Cyberlindnera jadinii]
MKLRGPPMASGTIEDIVSPEELETFMTIVFENFRSVFYIEDNLIDSARNVVYMMTLITIRTMCDKSNGLVDPAYISSWRKIEDVLENKEGFASRYYSFLNMEEDGFRVAINASNHLHEYIVIYRKNRSDLRSVLYAREEFSQFEQSHRFTFGDISNYQELTEKIFMSFKQPEQPRKDVSLYYPVIDCRLSEKLEKPHQRDPDDRLIIPPERQFLKSDSDALKAFLNEKGISAQPDAPPAHQEDYLELLNQNSNAGQPGWNSYIDVSSVGAIDAIEDALLESDDETDSPDVTGEGEPPTKSVDESWSDDEDEDLEIDFDIITFENAAFVFLEALKKKLKNGMDNFEHLTLDLFQIFIKYGIGSLSQSDADDQADTVAGRNHLKAVEALIEFTPKRMLETVQEAARSLSPATGLSYHEQDNHEINEPTAAPEYDFNKTKGARFGRAATEMILEGSHFTEKFANNMIRVLIQLELVRAFAVCINLCTVDSDVMESPQDDKPTEWTCPVCQTVNKKLQPGCFASEIQQVVFMISPRLYIACLFEDPSASNLVLHNSSKYHSQSTHGKASHTFYNGEYVKRMKQFNKRTMLSNEKEPHISSTKYFDESEIQLAVTLGWHGVAMLKKPVYEDKEQQELWPLVMRLVDFNNDTDFQLTNFLSITRENIGVDSVGDESDGKDAGNVTPSMLNAEMTNTKILLSCVTDEFVRIQRKGMLVKNHSSNSSDNPTLTVFATVVNVFGDLPALSKFVALRGTGVNTPCLLCNEVEEEVEDPNKLYSDGHPVTIEYNRWLSSEENGSSVSWTEKAGNEFEHLKHYVEKFDIECPIKTKGETPFSMTASLRSDGKFLQRDAEYREMLKSLCQWVKIPAQDCNPGNHGVTNCCDDSTHMRPLEKRLEQLLGVASLDIGSCTPIYDFDLSMGQNKIIGFDVISCLCENLFPKMLGVLSDSKDTFLLSRKYALPAPVLRNLMDSLESLFDVLDTWPAEFGEPPTSVDNFDVYIKAGQVQQLISTIPALLSSDYYSRHLDSDFLSFLQLFTMMSNFLLTRSIRKSEIPILNSTIKQFCSLHRYLFYERPEIKSKIKAWQLQALNNRRGAVTDSSTTSQSGLKEIPEVKLMIRMGSNYFHILIHVMTLIKEYGHPNLFSCSGPEKSMGTIKSTDHSTNEIITNAGRNMISRAISNCLSVVVAEMNSSRIN